jgi:hypothetical protein
MGYVAVDLSGRIVEDTNPALSSGLYIYTDESIQAMIDDGVSLPCGVIGPNGEFTGLRPGFMMVNGNRIETCSGELVENHLPDVVITDNGWKPFIKYVQGFTLLFLLLLIIKRLK